MDFRLLGPVRAEHGDRVVNLGPRQQRLVFAVLALQVGRLVTVDRLVDLLWPDSPPRTAEHAVRVCVSRLRSVLAGHAELLAQGAGYVLRTDPLRIDAHRFSRLVERARQTADDRRKVELLDEALAEWRGPALADAASDEIRERLLGGLIEDALVATEDRFDALLRLGRHDAAVGPLSDLVARYPTRERLVGQLMLALYRGGQPGQALDVARRTREYLAEELGIDPGHDLRELELAILREDPALATPKPRPRAPAQLPADIRDFTGRATMLGQLDAMIAGTPSAVVINAIAGTAGVGKTALAVHWAHRVRDRFPDGQLHVNLRGYATAPPMQPIQALTQFLRAIGVTPDRLPVDLDEAAATYRTLLSDKKMLILLDNAVSADQVRPLLPASPGCVVLITSRDRLDGLVALDGASRLLVDVLSEAEAIALLHQMLGDRITAESAAAAELAAACAYLPLALRIAAAHLAGQPGRSIADQVVALRAGSPLQTLRIEGDAAVAAAFDLSYAAQKPDAQRLFRLLGLVHGPDAAIEAAAALAETDDPAFLLDRLAAAHLIEEHVPGRYTFHDLLRRYAWERAMEEDGEGVREAALGRLNEYYLGTARAAVDLLYPYMLRLDGAGAGEFADHASAVAWLDNERANLVAAALHATGEMAWLLADTIRTYLYFRGQNVDLFAVGRAALAAAGVQPRPSAAAHIALGTAYYSQNEYPEAVFHYTTALSLCGEAGWVLGEAAMLNNLGVISQQLGRLDEANEHYLRSLALHRENGQSRHEAPALMKIGSNHQYRGELAEAASYYLQALESSRTLGSTHGEANALHYLGATEFLMGELTAAYEHNSKALELYLELGARNDEAQARAHLANVYRASGRYAEALDSARAALDLAERTGERRTETWVRNALGATHLVMGNTTAAAGEYQRSLDIAREIGARYEECEALIGLAESRRDPQAAKAALAIAEATGYRLLAAQVPTF